MTGAIRAVWATACTALLVWTVIAVIAGASQTSTYHHQRNQAVAATHFYRVIAGQDQAGIHVNDTLATDLRATPKDRLPLFSGTSNQYGGISAEIGVNPFDNTCGVECGHLTSSMVHNVEQARSGHPPTVTAAKHATSFLLPGVLFAVALIGGLLAMLSGTLTTTLRRSSARKSLRESYPAECRTLDRLQQAMDQLRPDGSLRDHERVAQYAELSRMHDGIEQALKMRIDPSIADDHLTEARTEKLMVEARQTLDAVETGNRTGGIEA